VLVVFLCFLVFVHCFFVMGLVSCNFSEFCGSLVRVRFVLCLSWRLYLFWWFDFFVLGFFSVRGKGVVCWFRVGFFVLVGVVCLMVPRLGRYLYFEIIWICVLGVVVGVYWVVYFLPELGSF